MEVRGHERDGGGERWWRRGMEAQGHAGSLSLSLSLSLSSPIAGHGASLSLFPYSESACRLVTAW